MGRAVIKEHFTSFYPEQLEFKKELEPKKMIEGFVLKVRLSKDALKQGKNVILDIPGFLTVHAGVLSKKQDLEKITSYEEGECYFVYADQNGLSPILSATMQFEVDGMPREATTLSVGIPLNLYPATDRDIFFMYDGIRFCLIANNEIVNVNYSMGKIPYDGSEMAIDETAFEMLEVCYDVALMKTSEECEEIEKNIAFYTPRGYNAWAGDVTNYYYNGMYHLLFFLDRHHHGNRFGAGAHSMVHLTTKDFVNWEYHGEIYPIRETWHSFGTGTMIYHQGKYYFVHGYHSSRALPEDILAGQLLQEQYEKNKEVSAMTYDEMKEKGIYPNGTNYLVSDDGIHFKKGRKQIHWAENPSVYVEEDGSLMMYAGYGGEGVWVAPHIDGPWRMKTADFPIHSRRSILRNSSECPSQFTWNDYEYLIMGFTGFWRRKKGEYTWTDIGALGYDIYDGLCVPMVAKCEERYILAGWLNGYGWGYVTQHRELIQREDGTLGTKWLPELTPNVDELELVSEIGRVTDKGEIEFTCRKSHYLECTILPSEHAKVGFGFSGEGMGCVLELNSKKEKVQIKETQKPHTFTEEVKALFEIAPELPDEQWQHNFIEEKNLHYKSCDFAIGNVREIKNEYKLKMILYYEPKMDSLIIDVQIGEGRTFISNRRYFNADALKIICENAEILDLRLYEME